MGSGVPVDIFEVAGVKDATVVGVFPENNSQKHMEIYFVILAEIIADIIMLNPTAASLDTSNLTNTSHVDAEQFRATLLTAGPGS